MIRREAYLQKIRPFVGKDVIKVLTGMRRSGKSTLLKAVREEMLERGVASDNIIAIDFESLQYEDLTISCDVFYREIVRRASAASGRVYLFFDEIQEVPRWEKAIDSFAVDLDCDIYLTGSNSKLLSGELASLLSGRYVTIEVQPFSFEEMLQACEGLSADEVFERYRTLGGLPFLSHIDYSPESSSSYLRDVFNSIVLKDIVARHGFRNVEQLERVLTYFVSDAGTTISVDNMANVLREERRSVTRDGIYNYLSAAEEALLLTRVRRQDVKGKGILRGAEKAYLTDVGLREALLGTNSARIDLVLENIVFCELRRRGYRVCVGKNGAREIDFVGERAGERLYVQVAYLLASEQTIEREFGAYDGVPDNFPKYVVSLDDVDRSRNGIRHLNIKDFLLSGEW